MASPGVALHAASPKASPTMTETTPLSRLEGRYLKALRQHIHDDAGTAPNRSLGDHAIAIGLETLDFARIHDQALAKLLPGAATPTERDTMTTQAGEFFTEAVMPLEETHRIALEASAHLMEIIETLGKRTEELTNSKRELERETSDREAAEAALKDSNIAFEALLRESRVLEAQLKGMAHQILIANEQEKRLVSHQLHDEIAQTLLGLHVRLLALKKEVADNNASITQEIAATQQLVEESVQTIQRFAQELGSRHES
jgi:two-component system sensor histidine kinase DegS